MRSCCSQENFRFCLQKTDRRKKACQRERITGSKQEKRRDKKRNKGADKIKDRNNNEMS
jgi:hypothetical protein